MAKEINFIRPQEVYDRNTGESKVRYRSYDGNDRFIPVMDREKGVPKTMVEVTHAELKAMRDNGKLTAGALYRITDYQCTTTQENTQSAGHQFDIVLLALSEDKLAEEGWAMMNESNVYDVTFTDGVTKKCYLYLSYHEEGDEDEYDITDVSTLLGFTTTASLLIINEENKSVTFVDGAELPSTSMINNTTYNYFQNSNLSAWKVWYCLDNDTSRFAWAQVGQEGELVLTDNLGYRWTRDDDTRNKVYNNETYYSWDSGEIHQYTKEEHPSVGSKFYTYIGPPFAPVGVQESGTIVEVTDTSVKEGRGVIYRLIDEFNNDVAYDFKNIQFVRKLTDGKYDPNHGEDTWCYTFSANSEDGIIDVSINGIAIFNKICGFYELPDNVRFGEGGGYIDVFSRSCTIINSYVVLYSTESKVIDSNIGIFFGGKKVLTEK